MSKKHKFGFVAPVAKRENITNKLFVYGIFLDEYMRTQYGMKNPQYATVLDYATYGHYIVKAYYAKGYNLALTGLLVDMNPELWEQLDNLEASYDRVLVTTTNSVQAYMYTARGNGNVTK
jgi:gamma-glutamylcyclotransferase (GGCT)/AIG2-like uncharacterized protein YtfP